LPYLSSTATVQGYTTPGYRSGGGRPFETELGFRNFTLNAAPGRILNVNEPVIGIHASEASSRHCPEILRISDFPDGRYVGKNRHSYGPVIW
jgi:hypothetical protein